MSAEAQDADTVLVQKHAACGKSTDPTIVVGAAEALPPIPEGHPHAEALGCIAVAHGLAAHWVARAMWAETQAHQARKAATLRASYEALLAAPALAEAREEVGAHEVTLSKAFLAGVEWHARTPPATNCRPIASADAAARYAVSRTTLERFA